VIEYLAGAGGRVAVVRVLEIAAVEDTPRDVDLLRLRLRALLLCLVPARAVSTTLRAPRGCGDGVLGRGRRDGLYRSRRPAPRQLCTQSTSQSERYIYVCVEHVRVQHVHLHRDKEE
jgi:hypothetical protein